MAETVTMGSVVSILYKGGITGEEPLDVRDSGTPLTVMVGDLKLPKGIEDGLLGMTEGEERTLEIEAADGYGEYQSELAQWYPRSMVDHGYTLVVGDVMFHRNPEDGHKQPAFVTEVTDDNVKIDFNHPFAGKHLTYWVKLVELR